MGGPRSDRGEIAEKLTAGHSPHLAAEHTPGHPAAAASLPDYDLAKLGRVRPPRVTGSWQLNDRKPEGR